MFLKIKKSLSILSILFILGTNFFSIKYLYAMTKCKGSPVKGNFKKIYLLQWKNCKGVLIWDEGTQWDGSVLEGDWKNGKANGIFNNTYPHGGSFKGEYINNS